MSPTEPPPPNSLGAQRLRLVSRWTGPGLGTLARWHVGTAAEVGPKHGDFCFDF